MNQTNTPTPTEATVQAPANLVLTPPTDPDPTPPAPAAHKAAPSQGEVHALKLERAAQGLDATIARLSVPAFQGMNLTRRRAGMRDSKRADCEREQKVQKILQAMAEAARAGTLPASLSKVAFAKQIRSLLWACWYLENGGITRAFNYMTEDGLSKMGITSPDMLQEACTFITTCTQGLQEKPEVRRLRELENQLIGAKIPGFFPTPASLIQDMLIRAEIQPGMQVLEPSAGKGDILQAIQQDEPQATLLAVERNYTLSEILKLKGFTVHSMDFLEFAGQSFDRVVMNPPFEDGQDMAHVQHAYSLLRPGGRLVSIMGEAPFFHRDRKSEAFRNWLDSVDAEVIRNPEGSFATSEAFRRTGTNTRLVVITRSAS